MDPDLRAKLLAMTSAARRDLMEFLAPQESVAREGDELAAAILASLALKKRFQTAHGN